MSTVRRFKDFGWENVPVLAYKEGGPYKGVTRQILFEGQEALPAQWRYFEVEPGGHSTLERHEHIHYVADPARQGPLLGRRRRQRHRRA